MSAFDDWQERQAAMRQKADAMVAEMEAAGYVVKATETHHDCRITVTSVTTHEHRHDSGRVTARPNYRQTSSCTAGYAFSVDAAHAKWQKHREALVPA